MHRWCVVYASNIALLVGIYIIASNSNETWAKYKNIVFFSLKKPYPNNHLSF